MDPLGQVVLSKLKKLFPEMEDAIIAGGFLRDHILGGNFKDIDIFFPLPHNREFFNQFLLKSVTDEFLNDFVVTDLTDNHNYANDSLFHVFNLKYKRTVPVQVMAYKYENSDKDFPEFLMKTFDYNICKMWSSGSTIEMTNEAERDIQNGIATLSYLKDSSQLPQALERYLSWKKKYPYLKFKTDLQVMSREELAGREKILLDQIKFLRKELEAAKSGQKIRPGYPASHTGYYVPLAQWIVNSHTGNAAG